MRSRLANIGLCCLLVLVLSLTSATLIRFGRGDVVAVTLWLHAMLAIVGILVLTRSSASPRHPVRGACANCGAPTFTTLRSDDRRAVRTCFACGFEDNETAPTEIRAAPWKKEPPTSEKPGPQY
jgi:hypothetical protein